jgi:uncharacterized protein (TIGR00270 family)
MCGSEGKLFNTVVEGAQLKVCANCSKFGRVTGIAEDKDAYTSTKPSKPGEAQPEVIQVIVEDYAKKIKGKREKLGLTQKEFGEKINEKESFVQKLESGHFEPPIDTAKKIGNFLKMNLLDQYREEHNKQQKTKEDKFTIGDFIKIKESK